ncbi:tetratricopeptide repeat protein [Eikenella sp. S3360]|uniref:Tetratricopeptide repeat protein n=1 Tax=Eikenella glucosivorans TaxID=2766967 RepID=A0ABS0N9U7_9NEIS|nr:tetratricopeptide repeat protein [Eikenella glucosivorans]MBH5329068.1 tetratricopeptide repeat protein [Eikenella glucosivorans]
MAELDDRIYEQITTLCEQGDALADEARHAEALEHYQQAWDLLPEPQTEWEAAIWILAAIGDTEFLRGHHEAARQALSHAMHCPDAIGNPFLHLRLGQTQFELSNFERAADELIRAYALGEDDLWADEDPKYLDFLATVCDGIENHSRKY